MSGKYLAAGALSNNHEVWTRASKMRKSKPNLAFFEGVLKEFRANLKRAVKFAGENQHQDAAKISHATLIEQTGIARSTLAKYLGGKGKAVDSNPDLQTICAIAHSLSVPPAFLLMRGKDWRHLAEAIASVASLRSRETAKDYAQRLANLKTINDENTQSTVEWLAHDFGQPLKPDKRPMSSSSLAGLMTQTDNDMDLAQHHRNVRRAVRCISAIPGLEDMKDPDTKEGLDASAIVTILAFCIQMGQKQHKLGVPNE